ncbi:hypothetical protein D9M69_369840 [compost metagenome]
MPSIWMVSRTRSRVVPAIGVTMASSAPASALSSEDLPTLGWPASTTDRPSRSSAPCRACASTPPRSLRMAASWPRASDCSRKSISSSGKSSVASTSMRRWITLSTSLRIALENSPSIERAAERAAASVLASIRSATASAWARSSLSLRKARRVNSPGSARRRPMLSPACRQRVSSICITTGPPWPCNSSTSSPVYELGAGKYSARPWSMTLPWPSRNGR